jgi:hypothetical protein
MANIHLITSVDFAGTFGNYVCSGELRCSRMSPLPPRHNHMAQQFLVGQRLLINKASQSHSHNLL